MSDQKTPPSAAETMRAAFAPFQTMQEEMTKMMGGLWSPGNWSGGAWKGGAGRAFSRAANMPALRPASLFSASPLGPMMGLPAADVSETEDAFVVTCELAGVAAKDVEVTAEDGVLTISAEKGETRESEDASYYMSERRYGQVQRAFPLPRNVDAKRVSTQVKDGVVTVTLPKTDAKAKTKPAGVAASTTQKA